MKEYILSEMPSVIEPYDNIYPLTAGGAADAALAEEIMTECLGPAPAQSARRPYRGFRKLSRLLRRFKGRRRRFKA